MTYRNPHPDRGHPTPLHTSWARVHLSTTASPHPLTHRPVSKVTPFRSLPVLPVLVLSFRRHEDTWGRREARLHQKPRGQPRKAVDHQCGDDSHLCRGGRPRSIRDQVMYLTAKRWKCESTWRVVRIPSIQDLGVVRPQVLRIWGARGARVPRYTCKEMQGGCVHAA